MFEWKEVLRLGDVWEPSRWNNDNIHELGAIIARRIKKLKAYDEEDWQFNGDCVERFANIQKETIYLGDDENTPFTPIEDFDEAMYWLYEWADENRVWVQRNF